VIEVNKRLEKSMFGTTGTIITFPTVYVPTVCSGIDPFGPTGGKIETPGDTCKYKILEIKGE